jgi:hypothetical protein
VNSDEDIEAMRVVGKLARECLDEGKELVKMIVFMFQASLSLQVPKLAALE